MSSLQLQSIVSNVKQMRMVLMDWFKGLPTYQKIITCIATMTGSLIARYLYCKLHRKFYNYPPGEMNYIYYCITQIVIFIYC